METEQARSSRAWVLAMGAFGVALAALIPAGAVAAAPMAHANRSAGAITCQTLAAEGNAAFGTQCDTDQWGPLANFTLAGPNSKYSCTSGWAEGSLWVQGQNCTPAS